jgi:PAS domain S-box-containing protein
MRKEETLQKSKESLDQLIQGSSIPMVITSGPEQKIITINRKFTDVFGYTLEDLPDVEHWWPLAYPDHAYREALRIEWSARILKAIETHTDIKPMEAMVTCRDGSIKIVEVSFSSIGDRNLVTLVDITDRHLAEQALRKSEAFLSSILEQSPFATWISDEKGTLIRINQACCDMLNIKPEEVIGRYNILHDSIVIKQGFVPMVMDVFEKGEMVRFEITYDSSQLNEPVLEKKIFVILDTSIFPIKDAQGKITNAVIQHKDITKIKLAEEEKRELQQRLYRAEKMEALGTLAGGVAHDLNNVLGVLVGYSELLLLKSEPFSPLRQYVTNIMKSGERAAAIVQNLLTMARRGVQTETVINLNDIIADFQKTPEYEKLLSIHPVMWVETHLEKDLLHIMGSPSHLNKAVMNLVINGSEAMPGGGQLIIATRNQYLDRPISGYDDVQEGDYVVLSISDTGGGITAADMPHIFEPFYTKKVMGRSGTGLGLAVVWGTVKDHRGYIDVRTEVGKGSAFTLYFPVTRVKSVENRMTVQASEYRGRGESILVVDDVEGQRELAAQMLEELNYRVEMVGSGEEAVTYLKEHQIDLVILDMIMAPGMDGLDTYRAMLKVCPQQKAIIVSGFSETERVNQARKLGVGAYLKKPYVMESLGLAIREELDR